MFRSLNLSLKYNTTFKKQYNALKIKAKNMGDEEKMSQKINRIYKLDEQINLNLNKDYINEMIEKYKDDEDKLSFLKERIFFTNSLVSW